MRTKHGRRHGLAAALAAAAGLLLAAPPAAAAELTVAVYVDLTIGRLELAHDTWTQEGRSPAETEEAEVCRLYDTDLDAYYAFAGAHREEIEDYLDELPEKRQRIETLAAEIAATIEQKEAQP